MRLTDAMRPVAGAWSLALRAEREARRAAGRRAEDAALRALDALLASRVGAEAVDRVLSSDLASQAVGKALEGPLVEAVARDVVRYAVLERLAGGVLDDPEVERALVAALDSPAAERLMAGVLESRLIDEAVHRLLEGDELWLVVEEIAQSPAVTEAITRQSIGFADQVAGGVRGRSHNADAWLERTARRALRRPPAAPPPDAP